MAWAMMAKGERLQRTRRACAVNEIAAMSARLVSFDQKRTELTPGTVLVITVPLITGSTSAVAQRSNSSLRGAFFSFGRCRYSKGDEPWLTRTGSKAPPNRQRAK
jgi:hypothetical protein